jgi:hypothetical protein
MGTAATATCAPLHNGNALVASKLYMKRTQKMMSKMSENDICSENKIRKAQHGGTHPKAQRA